MQALISPIVTLTTTRGMLWLGLPAAIPIGIVVLTLLTTAILVRMFVNTRRAERKDGRRR